MQKPSISIVGPGNLAAALSEWLCAAGYRLDEIVARPESMARARALARRVGARAVTLEQAKLAAAVIWLAVPDDAIGGVAQALAGRAEWKGKVALHSSGALTSGELASLRKRGAAVASVHPMMTFVRGAHPSAAAGIPFAVEGEAAATRAARRIVHDLRGEVVSVPPSRKPLYHVLGAFVSPLIVAELALAEQIARSAGIPARKTRRTVAPILRQTLKNYFEHGAAGAFSGPLVRGDLGTIRKHLRVLRAIPAARDAYLALARAAVQHLPVANRKQLERLLKQS